MTTKIAFYSPCEKCGTTTHMFLFAWMFARNNKKQSVVVEQGEQYRILRKGTTQERIVLSDCRERKDQTGTSSSADRRYSGRDPAV